MEPTLSFKDFRPKPREDYFDWRKGRIIHETFPRYAVLGGSWHLEPTQEEVLWWKKAWNDIDIIEEEINRPGYGQTLARLFYPKLGDAYALDTLKRIKIMERENLWNFDSKGNFPPSDEWYGKWKEKNNLVTKVAERILSGDPTLFDYLQRQDDDYICEVWHHMIQFSKMLALPYITLVPQEEAKKAIDSLLEDLITYKKITRQD